MTASLLQSPQPNRGFRVPCGLTESGELVRPDAADRSVRYLCPACHSPLTLKQGKVRKPHFAHRGDTACDGESALHQTAKLLIVQSVRTMVQGGPAITLEWPCPSCHAAQNRDLGPHHIDHAEIEASLGPSERVDVLLRRGSTPRLVVEVFHTHHTVQRSICWIEVSAQAIVNHPQRWTMLRGQLKTAQCKDCEQRTRIRLEAERLVEQKRGEILPKFPLHRRYKAWVARCWHPSCGAEIPLYRWFDDDWDCNEPPEPRPSTIQWRRSYTGSRSYWANVCRRCGRIQGDRYVQGHIEAYQAELTAEAERRLLGSANTPEGPLSPAARLWR